MKYETRRLSDIEFPVYISLFPTPGYNASKLNSLGIRGELILFFGNIQERNGSNEIDMKWGTQDKKIAGFLNSDMN